MGHFLGGRGFREEWRECVGLSDIDSQSSVSVLASRQCPSADPWHNMGSVAFHQQFIYPFICHPLPGAHHDYVHFIVLCMDMLGSRKNCRSSPVDLDFGKNAGERVCESRSVSVCARGCGSACACMRVRSDLSRPSHTYCSLVLSFAPTVVSLL